jgi:hypothetical protein
VGRPAPRSGGAVVAAPARSWRHGSGVVVARAEARPS